MYSKYLVHSLLIINRSSTKWKSAERTIKVPMGQLQTASLTLPVILHDCCPFANSTAVWGSWNIFSVLWRGFREGRYSKPQLYIQDDTQVVEIMLGYSEKLSLALYVSFEMTIGFRLYLCLLTSVSYNTHPTPPPRMLLFRNAISWGKCEKNVAVVDCQGRQLPLPFSS